MNGTRLLDTVHSPADVKRLDFGQLQELCAEKERMEGELAALYEQWEELSAALEEAQG